MLQQKVREASAASGGWLVTWIGMEERQLGECPTAEAIAAYLDSMLSLSEHHSIALHFGACPICLELIDELMADPDEDY